MSPGVYNIQVLNNEKCITLFEMLFLKSFKITEYLENLYIDQITNKYDKIYKISKYINNNKFILDNLFREYKKIFSTTFILQLFFSEVVIHNRIYDISRITSSRLLSPKYNGLLYGPRSPLYQKDEQKK
jgi:hypothetical protein